MLKNKYTPVSAIWEITLDCNMHCMHCGSSAGNARLNELSTKEALDVCKVLNQLGTLMAIPVLSNDLFIKKAVDALVAPERSADEWFSSMAGSMVPTIVADIARANLAQCFSDRVTKILIRRIDDDSVVSSIGTDFRGMFHQLR